MKTAYHLLELGVSSEWRPQLAAGLTYAATINIRINIALYHSVLAQL